VPITEEKKKLASCPSEISKNEPATAGNRKKKKGEIVLGISVRKTEEKVRVRDRREKGKEC